MDIRFGQPENVVPDGLNIVQMREVFIGSLMARVRADGFAGPGVASNAIAILRLDEAILWSVAELKEARNGVRIRRVLIYLSGRARRHRHGELHLVASTTDAVALETAESNVLHRSISPLAVALGKARSDRTGSPRRWTEGWFSFGAATL